MSPEHSDQTPGPLIPSEPVRRKTTGGICIMGILGVLLALVSAMIIVQFWSPTWGPDQWGNVGTWLAGVATLAAVCVSLWQASMAKKKSIKDELAAAARLAAEQERHQADTAAMEQRHQDEIERADRRLQAQLEHQMRAEEVSAVGNFCTAVNKIYNSTWSQHSRSDSFRSPISDPAFNEQIWQERQDWIHTVSNSAQDAALSLIGIRQSVLIDQAKIGVTIINELRESLSGPSTQKIDWTSVMPLLDNLNSASDLLRSMALLCLQPAYREHEIARALAQAPESPA